MPQQYARRNILRAYCWGCQLSDVNDSCSEGQQADYFSVHYNIRDIDPAKSSNLAYEQGEGDPATAETNTFWYRTQAKHK